MGAGTGGRLSSECESFPRQGGGLLIPGGPRTAPEQEGERCSRQSLSIPLLPSGSTSVSPHLSPSGHPGRRVGKNWGCPSLGVPGSIASAGRAPWGVLRGVFPSEGHDFSASVGLGSPLGTFWGQRQFLMKLMNLSLGTPLSRHLISYLMVCVLCFRFYFSIFDCAGSS